MDVIIEGQITENEGMDEVLQTVAELKSVQTPILRINEEGTELQGRIAFSQGGYIIGAKVNITNEVGYPALRKLLLVKVGNYAILDPLRRSIAELNQSLWIKAEKLVDLLPNLPDTPDGLMDAHPIEREVGSVARPKTGQIDLTVPLEKEYNEQGEQINKAPQVSAKTKARKFDLGVWRGVKFVLAAVATIAVAAGVTYVVQHWKEMPEKLNLNQGASQTTPEASGTGQTTPATTTGTDMPPAGTGTAPAGTK